MTRATDHELFCEHESEAVVPVPFEGGEVVVFTRRGPEKRCNEDSAAVLAYPGGGLLAVADGMGGLAGGERASRTTLEQLRQRMRRGASDGERLRPVVLDGLEAANHAVQDLGIGAGTTFAGVVLRDGNARAVHVGDSLVLHVGQRGKLKAQTRSHSPTGFAVEAGLLDEDEALHHEDRHLVSNFVGFVGMWIEVGSSVDVARHDTIVVASDGLTDNVRIDEVVQIVRKGPLEAAGNALAALALTRMATPRSGQPSKPDDLTFVLFRTT